MRSVAYVFILVVLATVLAVQPGCREKSRQAHKSPQTTQPAERRDNHLQPQRAGAALAVADAFCEAWRMGDYPTARLLLARRVVRKYPEKRLRDILAGPSNPQHVAYEIFDGQALGADRVVFRLRLFFTYTGRRDNRYEAPAGRIVLEREADGRWLVDAFPSLE